MLNSAREGRIEPGVEEKGPLCGGLGSCDSWATWRAGVVFEVWKGLLCFLGPV